MNLCYNILYLQASVTWLATLFRHSRLFAVVSNTTEEAIGIIMKDLYLYLIPMLEDTDVTTWTFTFITIFVTFVAFTLIVFAVCLASFLSEKFSSLSDVDKFTWCAKGTKVFYFPIPVFTGLWYLLVDDSLKNDVVNGTTKTSFIAMCMHIGFNVLDCALMAIGKLIFGHRFSTALFIHHFLVFTVYSVGVYYQGKAHYLGMLGFLSESAGPLSYIYWMLGKANLTHLLIWKVNQRVSVYLWHFRTILELYVFYILIKNWRYVWNEMPIPLLITFSFGVLVVGFGLTPRWTKVEAKRLYRQYSRRISFYVKDKNKAL